MKWVELNGKKDPPFNEELLIWLEEFNDWKIASLNSITLTPKGKVYEFEFAFDNSTTTKPTHYMIPESPKNNK
jgi:hypothetical protein